MNSRYLNISSFESAFVRCFDFVLFSNLFMSICAVAQALLTYQLIGVKPSAAVLLFFLCSTFISYNVAMLNPKHGYEHLVKSRRQITYAANRKLIMLFIMVCMLLLVIIYFLFPWNIRVMLIFLGIPSVFYNLPVLPVSGRRITPRSVIILKPVLIAIVWSVSTVIIPVYYARYLYHSILSDTLMYQLLVERFIFFCAMTIPYDIRDIDTDKLNGTKTIPVIWGVDRSYIVCLLLFLLYVMLLIIFKAPGSALTALLAVSAYTNWLIFAPNLTKNDYYFFFLLDGVFIIQYLALIIINYFK